MSNPFLSENLNPTLANYPVRKGGAGSGRYPAGSTIQRITDLSDHAEDIGHTWAGSNLSAQEAKEAAELHGQLARLHRYAVNRAFRSEGYHDYAHKDAAEANAKVARVLSGLARRIANGTATQEHFDRAERLTSDALAQTRTIIYRSRPNPRLG